MQNAECRHYPRCRTRNADARTASQDLQHHRRVRTPVARYPAENISLREARESLYWLRICEALKLGSADSVRESKGEADQLVRILTAIVVNTKRRMIVGAISAFFILNSAMLLS